MKKLFKNFGVLAVVGLLFGASCERSESPDPIQSVQAPPAVTSITKSSELTSDDAVKVAEMFHATNVPTRAAQRVRNVVTVPDAEGRPAIYAVNLEDGYLLVSATKRYYPILAQVDHGTFTLDGERFGLHVVLQEMVEMIEAVRADSTLVPESRYAWFPYEEHTAPELKTTSTRASDDLLEVQERWLTEWIADGRTCYYLNQKPDGMPDDMYAEFCELAISDDIWGQTEFNCMETAFITEKYCETPDIEGPFLTTQWKQRAPYNSLVPDNKPLGCVTIAVGQLMRYFQHPAKFDWSDMPDTQSSYTLSSFLAQLRTDLKVTDDGASNIDHAERVLKSYGYKCTKGNHSSSAVLSSLRKNRPTYTRGEDRTLNVGHAWVIDGSKLTTSYTEYKLYVLSNAVYPYFDYAEFYSDRIYHGNDIRYFHQNWGWGGQDNGWFTDARTTTSGGNFSSNRKDLIITGY